MGALAFEKNTDLAFDTNALRQYGETYGNIANQLRNMAKQLDDCLRTLKETGWTTPAGTAFHKMTETNWKDNIEKYASLLETLQDILEEASREYEGLIDDIERTKLGG